MIKDISSVKIGSLWNAGSGETFKEEIDAIPNFGPEVTLESPLTAAIMFIRMKDGITAIMEDLATSCQFTCNYCLEKFTIPITVKSSERHFYETLPERDYDPFEVFLINKMNASLDLTEMLRQEIILHFPMIPVCSKRCRGLCTGCRINLNHSDQHLAGCQGTSIEESEAPTDQHKPFANLKDLFKNHQK